MIETKKQANQLKLADLSLRKTIEKNLISAANEIMLPVHYHEILWISTEKERIAATGVVNCGKFFENEPADVLFLYLNVPGLARDFYRIQITPLADGNFANQAALVN